MQFEIGAKVFAIDGEKVGNLDRVVIEPGTNEVTHLVVEKGFLFTTDKVVPMDMVGPATEDRVDLRVSANELDQLPDFLEKEYVPAKSGYSTRTSHTPPQTPARDRFRALYLYPRVGTFGPFAVPSATHYTRWTENIPEGTVALKEDTEVIATDSEHVGNVERILTDPQEDRATHIVVSEGIFLKERKIVPTRWIKTVMSDRIHLSVDSELVDSLPKFRSET